MSQAFIVAPEDRPQLDLAHSRVKVLATSVQTDGEFTLMQTHTEPGGGPPLPCTVMRPRRSTCFKASS